jgi:signal transduction histidine kinase
VERSLAAARARPKQQVGSSYFVHKLSRKLLRASLDGLAYSTSLRYLSERVDGRPFLLAYLFLPDASGTAVSGLAGLEIDLDGVSRALLPEILGRLEPAPDVGLAVLDEASRVVAGADAAAAPSVVTSNLGPPFGFWSLGVFGRPAADAGALGELRTQVYLYVILLLLAAIATGAGLAVAAVRQQARLARLKTSFVSRVSHELRAPLTSIRLYTEMLELGGERTDSQSRAASLGTIRRECERLRRLIDQLLDFARIERGVKRYRLEHEEMGSLVRRIAENVQRRVQRLQETSRWSEPKRDYEVFQTSRAGLLTGLPSFDLGLGLSIRPALVGDVSKPGADEDRSYDATPSLDVTKTLGSNALASLTVNTDFAETESDARRTNLTRFDLFFPEKRTFFLQGSDIFDFGLGLDSGSADPDAQVSLIPFFTRRIGLFEEDGDLLEIPIDVGGKVNGRVGESNVGALMVRTREQSGLEVPGATMGVVRVKQNILDESSVGMLATFGDPLGRSGSWMGGVDFTYQTSSFRGEKNLLVGLWGLRNGREDLEGDKWAYGGKIDFPNDLWDASLSYIRLGEGFDPSLGFVPRTGKILEGGAEYRPRPGGELVRQLKFGAQSFLVADQRNRWESYLLTLKPLDVLFESGDSIEFLLEPQGERLIEPFEVEEGVEVEPGSYEWWRYNAVAALAQKRKLSGEVGWSFGGFYDGNLRTIEWVLVVKPSATFIAELGAERNDVELPEGSFSQDVYSARVQVNVSSDLPDPVRQPEPLPGHQHPAALDLQPPRRPVRRLQSQRAALPDGPVPVRFEPAPREAPVRVPALIGIQPERRRSTGRAMRRLMSSVKSWISGGAAAGWNEVLMRSVLILVIGFATLWLKDGFESGDWKDWGAPLTDSASIAGSMFVLNALLQRRQP